MQRRRQACSDGSDRRTGERLQRREKAFTPFAKGKNDDRGYDAAWYRDALKKKGIAPCIPPKKNRKTKYRYDKKLYKQRHKVENMFGRIKDWRRIAMRYDRCAHRAARIGWTHSMERSGEAL